ncbi:endonuclease domain-containing protein [Sphingomonas echinoides]|uniref:endonuclease domain-containing protein n=1 Tax=Sphingomonas echinoides TaxID=59803 RepID=UPI00241329DF|nr:DUF559 domain-containing protein [Sphingomonas echinoides]
MKRFRSRGGDLTTSLIESILASAKHEAAEAIDFHYSRAADVCESPIEKLFLAQMLHPETLAETESRLHIMCVKGGLVAYAVPPPIPGVYVYPQITIGRYRVDFLLQYVDFNGVSQLIVEVDGHDFHERTKEQAQRDKARDRALVSQGYRVLRFTGSEVFADPLSVALEAIEILVDRP